MASSTPARREATSSGGKSVVKRGKPSWAAATRVRDRLNAKKKARRIPSSGSESGRWRLRERAEEGVEFRLRLADRRRGADALEEKEALRRLDDRADEPMPGFLPLRLHHRAARSEGRPREVDGVNAEPVDRLLPLLRRARVFELLRPAREVLFDASTLALAEVEDAALARLRSRRGRGGVGGD